MRINLGAISYLLSLLPIGDSEKQRQRIGIAIFLEKFESVDIELLMVFRSKLMDLRMPS